MENWKRSDCWYKDVCQEDCPESGCLSYLQLKWQMENSGLPKAKQSIIPMTLIDEIDKHAYAELAKIRKNIVEYVEEGNNLYICSENLGNGKTSWAVRMLHTYFSKMAEGNYENLLGLYISVPDLLLRLKDFDNPITKEEKHNMKEVPLVIWDDIVVTNISSYDYLQLYTIINNRVFAEKANIFTGNYPDRDEFAEIVGERLASRTYDVSDIIELRGKGVR